MSSEVYDIRKDLLGRWIIVHPQEDGIAWTGARWVTHYKGVAIQHVQVANFETPNEAHEYALKHLDRIKEATIAGPKESTD